MTDLKEIDPKLYGINHSNRSGDDLWGKNQFNSTFPVSLMCFMRDRRVSAAYLSIKSDLCVHISEVPFDQILNTELANTDLYFMFEGKFDPYQDFSYDDIGAIDLVIMESRRDSTIKAKQMVPGKFLRALEIKLTVVPDHTTYAEEEKSWGPELVIRPATTIYCALGIAFSCREAGVLGRVREIFEPVCHSIKDWDNEHEINAKIDSILSVLDKFQSELHNLQKPMLMQPIWKTEGKSPILKKNAFDIFVWSDFALCRLFLDLSKGGVGRKEVNRYVRSAARLARFLYEVSTRGKVNIKSIYTEMAHNRQTDKEFAVNGKKTHAYMNSKYLLKPRVQRDELKHIILNGGEQKLNPERRFDQTVYFTTKQIFERS
jgi:hypothetical protein